MALVRWVGNRVGGGGETTSNTPIVSERDKRKPQISFNYRSALQGRILHSCSGLFQSLVLSKIGIPNSTARYTCHFSNILQHQHLKNPFLWTFSSLALPARKFWTCTKIFVFVFRKLQKINAQNCP